MATLSSRGDAANGARWLNLALGIWLFISAFIWQHTLAAQTNTWILGVIIALAALLAIVWMPTFRWVNTAAAVWLFFSTLAIVHMHSGTVWNNLIVAVVVFVISLVGPETGPTIRHRDTAVPA